jgi:hypothetical protein
VEGNTSAREQQQVWLEKQGHAFGFDVRNAGLVTEVELPVHLAHRCSALWCTATFSL